MSLANLSDVRVLAGVCGGISAMGSPHVLYWLKSRLQVARTRVVLTQAAHRFVTPQSFADLLGEKPMTTFDDLPTGESHVGLARSVDVIIVLPATANTLTKLANGMSDNLLCATVMAAPCPVILVPAMSETTWCKPVMRRAVGTLREDGYQVIDPGPGVAVATGDREVGSLGDFRKPVLAAIAAAARHRQPKERQ